MSVIYLDNNATTSVAPEVFESMIPFFTEKYGNASSMHTFGGQVGKSIQDAREKVAAMLGAQPEDDRVHLLRHGKRFHCRDVRFAGAA